MNEGHRDWPAAIFGKDNFHGVGSLLMGTGWVEEAGDRDGPSRPGKNKGINSPSLGVSGPSSYFT